MDAAIETFTLNVITSSLFEFEYYVEEGPAFQKGPRPAFSDCALEGKLLGSENCPIAISHMFLDWAFVNILNKKQLLDHLPSFSFI